MRYRNKVIHNRESLDVDTVYVNDVTSEAIVTPDCIGIIYYETEEEAIDAHDATSENCFLITADEFHRIVNE